MTFVGYRPAARLTIDGKDIMEANPEVPKSVGLSDVLVSITVTDEAGRRADAVEIEIDNSAGFKAPPIGSEIKVWLGYEPQPVYMGSYKVVSWGKRGMPRMMSVVGISADVLGDIKSHKLRAWHQMKLGEIVRKIAGEHGLIAEIEPSLEVRYVDHIDQQTESDLAFLSRLAKRNGAVFKIGDGKIQFVGRGARKNAAGKDKPVHLITPLNTTEWSLDYLGRGEFKAAKAAYMDHATGKRHYVTAGAGSPYHRDKLLYGSEAEARHAAQATLDDLTRGRKQVEVGMAGNPDLYAEGLIRLEGFDPEIDGDYLAETITHKFNSSSGYTTSLEMVLSEGT